MRLVGDIETNGLLDRADLRYHCAVAADVDTGEVWEYGPGEGPAFIEKMLSADTVIGHNFAGYDIPVLERLFDMTWSWDQQWLDTLVWSQAVFGERIYGHRIKYRNSHRGKAARDAAMPENMLFRHSLRAWMYHVGMKKGDFLEEQGVQEEFSPELMAYCRQDVLGNVAVFRYLETATGEKTKRPKWPVMPLEVIDTESKFLYLAEKQQEWGVGFDTIGAQALDAKLCGRLAKLEHELAASVDPICKAGVMKTWKKTMESKKYQPGEKGYFNRVAGVEYQNFKYDEFSPTSRVHVGKVLKRDYGWKPREWGKDGYPSLDDEILGALPYPLVPRVREAMMLSKRIGQVSSGKEAWLRHVKDDGTIHGRLNTLGCRTHRCSHSKPNTGQVVKVAKPYGKECRSLFRPTGKIIGAVQVGADATALELRCLAHRLAFWDDGNFAKLLLEGDPHSDWQAATTMPHREGQKELTFSFLYGAQDFRMGSIYIKWCRLVNDEADKRLVEVPALDVAEEVGEYCRDQLFLKVPGLQDLFDACHEAFKVRHIVSLDGRPVICASKHSSVNDLLQTDGAVVMKHARVIFHKLATKERFILNRDYGMMLNVHDEWQIECLPEQAKGLGRLMVHSIVFAGEKLNMRLPLDGEYKVGNNWMETH